MDAQEMHGRGQQVSMTSLKVKTRSPCCQCLRKSTGRCENQCHSLVDVIGHTSKQVEEINHVLDEEYQITHILASLPREYSSVVEQVKIDRRTGSTLITMDEIKKRLKEC